MTVTDTEHGEAPVLVDGPCAGWSVTLRPENNMLRIAVPVQTPAGDVFVHYVFSGDLITRPMRYFWHPEAEDTR